MNGLICLAINGRVKNSFSSCCSVLSIFLFLHKASTYPGVHGPKANRINPLTLPL